MTAGGHRHAAARPVLRAGHAEPDRAGRAPIPCPRPSSTGSCSRSSSPIRRPRKSGGSTGSPPGVDEHEITPMLDRRADRGLAAAGAAGAGLGPLHRLRDGPGPGDPRPRRTAGPSTSATGSPGAPGPRAGQSLILAAKATAALAGRPSVSVDDIRAVALPVLRHRIVINYNAQAAGESSDSIVKKLL